MSVDRDSVGRVLIDWQVDGNSVKAEFTRIGRSTEILNNNKTGLKAQTAAALNTFDFSSDLFPGQEQHNPTDCETPITIQTF